MTYPPTNSLCWPSATAYYTDGACKKIPGTGTALGASFYMPSSDTTFLIKPGGTRETKTIMRAELAAIYAALLHILQRRPPVKAASVFTDSLASIYLIQRVLINPLAWFDPDIADEPVTDDTISSHAVRDSDEVTNDLSLE